MITNFLSQSRSAIKAVGPADVKHEVVGACARATGGVAVGVLAETAAAGVARSQALVRTAVSLIEPSRARGRDQVGSSFEAAVV